MSSGNVRAAIDQLRQVIQTPIKPYDPADDEHSAPSRSSTAASDSTSTSSGPAVARQSSESDCISDNDLPGLITRVLGKCESVRSLLLVFLLEFGFSFQKQAINLLVGKTGLWQQSTRSLSSLAPSHGIRSVSWCRAKDYRTGRTAPTQWAMGHCCCFYKNMVPGSKRFRFYLLVGLSCIRIVAVKELREQLTQIFNLHVHQFLFEGLS